jgi:FMN phosphatase YigB (HAD superfamily)
VGGITESPESLAAKARALIFDLDGTLFDSGGLAARLVFARPMDAFVILAERRTRKTLSGCDYGSAEAYYGEFFSRMSRMIRGSLIRGSMIRRSPEKLRVWYFDRYMPRMCGVLKEHYCLRPGTAGLFEYLARASVPFAVYSDYPWGRERLSALGLETAYGGKLYGPEHFGAQKPAVRPFLTIAQDLNTPPDRILVIGDREDTDGGGAASAGMGYIGVRNHKKQKNYAYPLVSWDLCTLLLQERFKLRDAES